MILRSTPYPPVRKESSCEGEWTNIISASPLWARAIAAPVPSATKLTVIRGYLVSKACFMVPVVLPFIPMSSSPVSCRLVVVATVRVVGVGVGEGEGDGEGVGEAVGVAVGWGEAVGEGDVPGVGEGVAVGDGVGVGVGCGF